MSENSDISMFTVHKIILIKLTCLYVKVVRDYTELLSAKQDVLLVTLISFLHHFNVEFAVPCPG